MNTGDLMAKLEANKKPLAIAGAAGVAGLALLQRKKAGGDVGVAKAGSAPASAASGGGTLANPGGQAVYSSASSDVYNALQPQLSTIGQQVNQLLAGKSETVDNIPLYTQFTVGDGHDLDKIAGWYGISGGGDYLFNYGGNRAIVGNDGKVDAGQVIQVPTPHGAWVAANPGASR